MAKYKTYHRLGKYKQTTFAVMQDTNSLYIVKKRAKC